MEQNIYDSVSVTFDAINAFGFQILTQIDALEPTLQTIIAILIAIGATTTVLAIAILVNQRKIKKQLRQLLENKDKPN